MIPKQEEKTQMKITSKQVLIPFVAAAAILVGAVTMGGLASANGPGGDSTSLLTKVAAKLSISVDTLTQAFKDARVELIDEAVADGKITSDKADAMKQRVEEGNGLNYGRGEHGRRGGHGFKASVYKSANEAITTTLSVTTEELRTAMKEGKSLVDIATEKSVTQEQLSTAVLAAVRTQLDQAVTDGDITQEQADQRYEAAEENIDDFLTRTPRTRRGGHERRGHDRSERGNERKSESDTTPSSFRGQRAYQVSGV